DAAGGRRALDAEFCGAARREFWIRGRPHLRNVVAVAPESLQNGGASEQIFPAPAGTCEGAPWGGGCGGIERSATGWRPGQQDGDLRQVVRGAMARAGAKRQRGIFPRAA